VNETVATTGAIPAGEIARRLEAAVEAMEAALARGDWPALARLGEEMNLDLAPLVEAFAGRGPAGEHGSRADLAQRFAALARRHDALLDELVRARDLTAAELGFAVEGHRGASEYLLAAGGS
jgi:hypothetical protein